ncbi:MAG: STAS domain-containing protein [Planctomycetes bacterium]|nr:STAS domain-containing protein [Planctomycetota bacterium]
MKVEQERVGTVDVLSPMGALVDEDAEMFCRVLQEHVRQPNPRIVVVMQGVPYMDSKALEGLLDATEDLNDRALSLKLAGVTATCREILELTDQARHFRFFNDVQDAVRSYL